MPSIIPGFFARRVFGPRREDWLRLIPLRGPPLGAAQIETALTRRRLYRRFVYLRLVAPSAVKDWARQEARALEGETAPDLDALRAAARLRFAPTLPAPAANALELDPAAGAVAVLAWLVLMELVEDEQQDLQAKMAEAQQLMQAKAALRQLLEAVFEQEAGAADASPGAIVPASFAALLSRELAAIGKETAALPFPLVVTPTAELTFGALASIEAQLAEALDAMNELSEMSSIELQMLMDARTKLLETASDIEKSFTDTDIATVANLKQ